MNARRLLSALLLALVGSAFFTFWLSKKFSKPQAVVPHQRQYVALVKPADAGETLQKAGLTMVDWPEASPVDGAFAKVDDVAGRTLLYPVSAGEPITEHQLAAQGAGAGLSARIPDGMRAISLKSDQIVGVAGFLLPGTHVDVLVTYHIAAGQKMQPDPDGKVAPVDVVTLLVNPMDAERVVLASMQGSVHFVLRNGDDHTHVDETSADLSELGGPQPPKLAPVKLSAKGVISVSTLPPPYVVQTVAGDKQTREIFQ